MSDPSLFPNPPLKYNNTVNHYGTPIRASQRGRSLHPLEQLPMALIRERSHQATLKKGKDF